MNIVNKNIVEFDDIEFNFHPLDHKGIIARIDYDNGYSASVIQCDMSYGGKEGLYEIALMKGNDIVYDTPITDNVLGYLSKELVSENLKKISLL